jgi:hypothetical protein
MLLLFVSFVRSVLMDSWTQRHLKQMEVGGNAPFLEFLKEYGLEGAPMQMVYDSPAATAYRDKIQCLVDKKPWAPPPREQLVSNAQKLRAAENASLFGQKSRPNGETIAKTRSTPAAAAARAPAPVDDGWGAPVARSNSASKAAAVAAASDEIDWDATESKTVSKLVDSLWDKESPAASSLASLFGDLPEADEVPSQPSVDEATAAAVAVPEQVV